MVALYHHTARASWSARASEGEAQDIATATTNGTSPPWPLRLAVLFGAAIRLSHCKNSAVIACSSNSITCLLEPEEKSRSVPGCGKRDDGVDCPPIRQGGTLGLPMICQTGCKDPNVTLQAIHVAVFSAFVTCKDAIPTNVF